MQGDRVQRIFDALSSPIRREILWLTWNDELTVGQIAEHFEVSSPTLSSHLAALRSAELVTIRIDGNFRRYRCNHAVVDAVIPMLAVEDERWVPAHRFPERALARARHLRAIAVYVDVALDPATAFDSFTDAVQYSQWLGMPVRIDNGHFAATMDWGTEVRGHYDVVAKPELIAMTWDFDDDAVPVPGRQLTAYLRIAPTADGARVEVHQLADNDTQASFLATAWETVLGRFSAAHSAPTSPRSGQRHTRQSGQEEHTMKIPKPTDADRERFHALVPDGPAVETKPMFGNLGAFVNGNMFMGLFGSDVGVKLDELDRSKLAAKPGTGPFGPAERPMAGYVSLPPKWTARQARTWTAKALASAAALPPKQSKKKAAKK